VRTTCLALLALATLAPAGHSQTAYSYNELIPWSSNWLAPFAYPLFDRAFTSGRAFQGVKADSSGNVYVCDGLSAWKITAQGAMLPVAGFGPATVLPGERVSALLATTSGCPVADSHGNLFFRSPGAILSITPDGLMQHYLAINGYGLAIDSADRLYTVLNSTQVVRLSSDGSVVVAGTGQFGFSGDGGPAVSAQLSASEIAPDAAGNLWIADTGNNRIRRVDPNGTISTVAEVTNLGSIAAGPGGVVYYSQYFPNSFASVSLVKRVDAAGNIEAVAGLAYPAPYRGDGGPANVAPLQNVLDLAVDPAGNLYIADSSHLRMVDTAGIIHTVAGCPCGGDGVPVGWAQVGSATGIARDASGNILFSDQGTHMVRRIAPDGTITNVAGTGEPGYSGDGGLATQARLSWPAGLAFDAAGNLYIADEQNSAIRKVTPSGIVQTVAGNGVAGSGGDGGAATAARLAQPDGVAVDASGNLYIADSGNNRIRKVDTSGVIRTIAGTSQFGSSGDGGPAALASLINPRSLAFDQAGNLLFTDSADRVVRRITPAGIIERVAGTGLEGAGGDGGPALAASFDLPWGIAVDNSGDILIGDSYAVRLVDRSGTIRTIGHSWLNGVAGVVADNSDNVWIAANRTIELLSPGALPFPLGPVINGQSIANYALASSSQFNQPHANAAVAPGEIVSISGTRLGPGTPATANPAATQLAGTRVLFDGVAAPVLSASASQVSAIVPFGISGKSTVGVVVEVGGVKSNTSTVVVLPAVPALFTDDLLGAAAAVNQDGTVNGPRHPAPAGSVLALFATGGGEMTPTPIDGALVPNQHPPAVSLPVSVTIGTRPAEVLYAGGAPGSVSGGLQVNVRVPTGAVPYLGYAFYTVELRMGNGKSQAAHIWIAN
jgi:uncharacterized protein (TIGR03437 family)